MAETNTTETKKCKYCQTDIPKKAKVCPNCKRTIKGGPGCLVIFVLMIAFSGIMMSITSPGGSPSPELITMEEYNKIQSGMTYDEVKEIIGSGGELTSTVSANGYTVSIYSWYGNKTTGANANVTFENGKVIGKAQVGLQ